MLVVAHVLSRLVSCCLQAGNTDFKAKRFPAAIQLYGLAIKCGDGTQAGDTGGATHLCFSNRSACFAARKMWREAEEDGLAWCTHAGPILFPPSPFQYKPGMN